MEQNFWHERWEKEEIGFHLKDTNPFLKEYWKNLNTSSNDTIFVPLCGKSLDLLWLAEHVKHVIGNELSQKAVEGFFSENDLIPTISQGKNFIEYRYENITLLCGDFFQLTPSDLPECRFIYDRASLIAFPPDMRQQYVDKLASLLPEETRRLLVTIEYPQHEMDGPPFSIPPADVQQLFSQRYRIDGLETKDILEASPRFKNKGITRMFEHVFLLSKKIT